MIHSLNFEFFSDSKMSLAYWTETFLILIKSLLSKIGILMLYLQVFMVEGFLAITLMFGSLHKFSIKWDLKNTN